MALTAIFGLALLGITAGANAGGTPATAPEPARTPDAGVGSLAPHTSIFADDPVGNSDGSSRSKIHRMLARTLEEVPSDQRTKAWVFFRNKGLASSRAYDLAVERLAATYNRRAVERRIKRRTLPDLFDERDLPVVPKYTAQVEATGAQVHIVSKWLNGVSVYATRDQIRRIARLPFVRAVQPVRRSRRTPEDGLFSSG
ncbi:MAG: YlbG family protein, partial [Planctomycetota bacterium]